MQLAFSQVDAFATRPFTGNPAAVVRVGSEWLADDQMASIAAENNLSETAFVRERGPELALRWFTPTVEVALCGHATLAAGWVMLQQTSGDAVSFDTRSGTLWVRREGDRFALELPAIPPHEAQVPDALIAALGAPPAEVLGVREVHHARYWLARYASEAQIASLAPDIAALRALRSNVICTAPGEAVDFVSRFFAPGSGVDEDPVTGSAHCTLTPFWAARLGKDVLEARQISARGGDLGCTLSPGEAARVTLRGGCVQVIEGTLTI